MIELREVSKTVRSGSEPLTILHPLSFDDRARTVRRHRRAVGQRQVDAARADRGARRADVGLGPRSTASTSRALDEDALAKLRGEKIGFVFQFFHLIPSLTAYENVAVPMEIAGAPDAAAARRAAARGSGSDGPRPSLSVAALRRRAAARRAGARARQRSADRARRRADRQSRHRQRPAHHGAAPRRSTSGAARRSCW